MANRRQRELFGRFCALSAPAKWPSCALLVAHPDDESIGAGARLSYLKRCRVLYLTDGAPRNLRDAALAGYPSREAYAVARIGEATRALELADIASEKIVRLSNVDQESAWALGATIRFLVAFLRQFRPDILLTHAYEGGHPDHDSAAFAAHTACRYVGRLGEKKVPLILEMPSYHAWRGAMRVGKFLPNKATAGVASSITLRLNKREASLKRRMFQCHTSQSEMLRLFNLQEESFRIAPRYDFDKAPHEGALFYEWFDWGLTGQRWRELAALARDAG